MPLFNPSKTWQDPNNRKRS